MSARVCVLGAGVVGLSSALATLNALPTAQVTVMAQAFTPNTTSDGAFGLWEPYMVGNTPPENIRRWGGATLRRMLELARSSDGPGAGAFELSGYNLWKSQVQDPVWRDVATSFRHMEPHELRQYGPQYVHGWFYTSAATECRFYLPWLMDKLKQKGVTFVKADVGDLSELANSYDVIVNCTGLGSRDLVHDDDVKPIQGQVIRVQAPWVKHFLSSDDDDLYILPGADSVVLGGTHVEGEWGTDVDLSTKSRILAGCQRLMPSLKNAQILRDWVGLRPARSSVRLEPELYKTHKGTVRVVHNYGHGGAGITLHWGCALEVADLISQLLKKAKI